MNMLAIDNETFLIERARPFPPVVCLSWATAGERSTVMPHTSVEEFIEGQLAQPLRRFVGHNVAYDFATIAASYPRLLPAIFAAYKAGRITDTQLRQQLIMIASRHIVGDDDAVRGYGLAHLYESIFDRKLPGPGANKGSVVDAPAHVRHTYGELYYKSFDAYTDEQIEYSREDAIGALAIHDEQQAKAGTLLRDDAFQAYSYFVLSLVSANGMRTDPGRTAALKAAKQAEAAALEPELVAEGMLESQTRGRGDQKVHVRWVKKMNVARQRVYDLCAARGVNAIDPGNDLAGILLTKTGREWFRKGQPIGLQHISIDRTACNWLEDPLLLRRAKYVSANKVLETYVPALEKGFVLPITSRYGLAATGRTTAGTPSQPLEGTALQTMPREPGVRECFVPRQGKIYVMADFEGAEMHSLAQVCKHDVVDYDDLALRVRQGDPEAKLARQNSKPVNFGFGGFMHGRTFVNTQLKELRWRHLPGGGVERLGKIWTIDEADIAREAWLMAYPEMPAYFDFNRRELGHERKCTIELLWSKRLRMVRGMPTICNTKFQSLTADGAKKAVNEVVRTCLCEPSSALYRNHTYGVNFVHDELIAETDDGDIDMLQLVAAEFGEIMEREFNELVPDYPTTVEVVLARYWSKGAKPVHDEQGRLIPWNG